MKLEALTNSNTGDDETPGGDTTCNPLATHRVIEQGNSVLYDFRWMVGAAVGVEGIVDTRNLLVDAFRWILTRNPMATLTSGSANGNEVKACRANFDVINDDGPCCGHIPSPWALHLWCIDTIVALELCWLDVVQGGGVASPSSSEANGTRNMLDRVDLPQGLYRRRWMESIRHACVISPFWNVGDRGVLMPYPSAMSVTMTRQLGRRESLRNRQEPKGANEVRLSLTGCRDIPASWRQLVAAVVGQLPIDYICRRRGIKPPQRLALFCVWWSTITECLQPYYRRANIDERWLPGHVNLHLRERVSAAEWFRRHWPLAFGHPRRAWCRPWVDGTQVAKYLWKPTSKGISAFRRCGIFLSAEQFLHVNHVLVC